jgi:two-component system, NtrC family, nitrogen regulation response regulator NtrX
MIGGSMAQDILIVDDEADIRSLIAGILGDEGYQTREAANASDAMTAISARRPGLVILDIWLQGSAMDGLQILESIKRDHMDVPVIMISGHGTVETAVLALKKGAYDFIEKPFKADRLLALVGRAMESARLRRENEELKQKAVRDYDLIGKSSAISHIRQAIDRVAPTGSRVLISGPAGSGKEIVARMIHAKSRRADGPFVVMNCATMRPDRLEVELFGTEQGAAGAPRKVGLFEQAHNGTLLLDEIADMPPETQGKIVRILQDQTFERVGGTTKVQVDVRVLASTNHDLAAEVADGKFRQDLYYRLSVVPIRLPSLAERKEDIPHLARFFMTRAAEAEGMAPRDFGEDGIAAMQAYDWPGNVRQLRNVIYWLLVMAGGDAKSPIRADMLPPELVSNVPPVLTWDKGGEIMGLPLRDAREVFEREYLLAQVTRFGGNISRTAHFIGMERSALHRKLKLLGVHGNLSERLN